MRLVILGFGYSASFFAKEIRGKASTIHVTSRDIEKVARLKSEGWNALRFDGKTCSDDLASVIHSATHILVSAPPDADGDPVLLACADALHHAQGLERVIYLSTVGVYGDHGGAWVNENTPLKPVSLRSTQRVSAEEKWQDFAREKRCDLAILRLSGIYGPGRNAIENLRAGTARRLIKQGQVFNRIHVEDIAGATAAAFAHQGRPGVFNVSDDEPCPPQDVVTHAAHMLGVSPPPEIPFETAALSAMARSFYSENKRVSNARIKAELGYRFRYPSYREGLAACLR